MRRVLFLVVLLIVHGTLYPWEFHSRTLPTSAVLVLLRSWSAPEANRYVLRDVAVNLFLYVPLGIFGYLAFRNRARKSFAIAATLVLAVMVSASLEIAQIFVPTRTCSLFDVLLNLAGAAFGGALALRYEDRLVEGAVPGRGVLARAASGPLLLLCCWVGYQLFPFFPDLSRMHLAGKLRLLLQPDSWSPARALVSFAEWMAVATLIEPVGLKRARAFLILLLLLPIKLLCAGRTVTGAELVGAVAGLLAAGRLHARGLASPRAVAWLLLLALVVDGLVPFHFQHAANGVRWTPFEGTFESDWQSGFAILLRKSFAYGSVVWLFRRSGWPRAPAVALTSVCLAAVEAAQVYLPGRTAETTDPLLVVLMAAVLSVVEGRETAESTPAAAARPWWQA